MANILSLALKVTADASGLKLDPVQRALVNLGDQADKLTGQFDKFAAGSAGAARAQQEFANRSQELINNLRDGGGATQFAAAFEKLAEEARNATAAFEEGARVTASVRTEEEKRAVSLQRLSSLLDQGAIDAETYARSVAASSSGFNGTQFARFSEAIAPLQRSLQEGTISLEQFQRSAAGIADSVAGSTSAAQRSAEAILELKSRLDAGSISLSEYRAQFSQIQSGNFTSKFELQVVGVREGVEATEKLQAAVSSLQGTQIEAALRVSGTDTLNDLRQQFDGIDGREIDAVLKILGVDTVDDARERLAVIDGTTVEAQLKAVGIESIEQAQRIINGLEGKDITVLAETLGATSVEQLTAIINAVESRTVTVETSTNADDTAAKVAALVSEQEAYKQLLQEGARITEQFRTEEEKRAETLARLDKLLAQSAITEETYNRAVAQASGAAEAAAAAEKERARVAAEAAAATEAVERARKAVLDEGLSVAEKYATAEEKRAKQIARLDDLVAAGAISEETYNRALADVSGANEAAAKAEKERADALASAARIIQANLTAQERYEQNLRELNALQQAGVLTGENYNRAVAAARKPLEDAAAASEKVANAGKESTLQFNELSGVFSVLPGPLGNIAGRISGISSASEGLSRIFAGGLTSGFQGLAASVTALVNPFTLALAGITAFAAGATAVINGLTQLEDRVEKLGNTADKLGVSFEFIQTLEEAANRSGTSIDAVSAAFGRLQKNVLGVDEESKAAQKALAEIGITAEELAALSPEEQYQKIGRAIADIEDPARRTATATALFGKAGADLIPFFNNIGGAADDIERYGRALSGLDRRNVDELGGSLDALAVSTQGLGQSLLLPFVGLGDGIARGLAEVTAGITAIVDPIGRILEPLLTQIGRVIEGLGVALGTIGRVIGAVFEPFAVVVQSVAQALEPLYESFLVLQRTLADSVVTVAEWVTSFTPIGLIASNVGALGETLFRVVTIITTAFQRVGEFVGGLVSRFGELAAQSPLLQTLGTIVSSVFGNVASVFTTIANAVGGVVGRLLTMAENFLGIDRSAQQAAEATQNLGGQVEALTQEEQKAAAEREKFLQGFTNDVSKAIDESAKFGQAGFDAALQYQNSINDLRDDLDRGILNEESFRREAEKAQQAYNAQIDIAKKAAAEIEANTKRVDGLLAKANAIPQIEQDLNIVNAEIARTEAALATARESGTTAQADALAARLSQLDQLQAGLQDTADQAAQGFSQGFDSAFANVDSGINSLIDKATEFGQAGFDAAKALQDGIAAAKEQVRDGILSKPTFDKEVERQKRLYEQRIDQLKAVEKLSQDIAKRQDQLDDKRFEITQARAEELANIQTGSIKVNDLRSGGISAFFDALKEDPAIAEAKKQTKELEKMRQEIAKLNAEKVDILAGTG